MNALNACQTDALTELINIAFGLTAAKLSEISGSRVLLDAPIIGIHPVQGFFCVGVIERPFHINTLNLAIGSEH